VPVKRLLPSTAILLALGTLARADDTIAYIAGSTRKICQVTGETDHEFNTPTASRTQTRYGLIGADLGYSFEHNGRIFFLFGDADPTDTFNGHNNGPGDPPRILDDNDATGFVRIGSLQDHCPKLDFIVDSIGAYQNPVVLDDRGKPAITLRTNEMPISGISQGGRMYVIFGTDNPYSNPTPPTPQNLAAGPTRTVMGVSDDDGNTFHYLYDFSRGPCTNCEGAKFIYTAIARGQDDYVYIWGSEGGLHFRMSRPYLARKRASLLDFEAGTEYFSGMDPEGQPRFSGSESDAAPLFTDDDGIPNPTPAPCMAHKGVEWNRFVGAWVMLYDCTDRTLANLPGIYMRYADNPWGPWSPPQTVFNAGIDHGILQADGACAFIYTDGVPCPNPARPTVQGGNYAPYFISLFTTGDENSGASTFYWTMATFNPYTQMIMTSAIQRKP
jgi:hypothetical protein